MHDLHPSFVALTESLNPSFLRLTSMPPVTGGKLPPDIPLRGIYLFSENGEHLYVGRSNNLRNRYKAHTLPSSKHHSAAFAMLLTRCKTGRKATYRAGPDSRKSLSIDTEFDAVFQQQKQRIRAMEFRYVEEPRPLEQTLLEVYCALVLKTPYNDFDNH